MLIIEYNKEEVFDILSHASVIYDGLSPQDIKEIESLALDRSHFSRDDN